MKKAFFVAVLYFAFVVAACDKVDDLLTFYMEEEETIENNKTRAELVKDVTLNRLNLKLTNAELDEFIKGETYSIRTKAALAKPDSGDITIKADMRFKVTADPI